MKFDYQLVNDIWMYRFSRNIKFLLGYAFHDTFLIASYIREQNLRNWGCGFKL